jgi:hypothetical protein
MAWLRPQRQTNADLACPLRHRVGHYSEDAYLGQQQRDTSEVPQQDYIETARAE